MTGVMLLQGGLGLFSGSLIGFSLGLVGGGGSILAVPLLVYVVGVGDPHVAIGTSAVPAMPSDSLSSGSRSLRLTALSGRCSSAAAAVPFGWIISVNNVPAQLAG